MLGSVPENGHGFKIRYIQFKIPRSNALYVFPIIASRNKDGSYRCNRIVDKSVASSFNPTNKKVNLHAFLPVTKDMKQMEEEKLPEESADHLLHVLTGMTTQLNEIQAKILFATLKISEGVFDEEPQTPILSSPQPIGLQNCTTIAAIMANGASNNLPQYIDDLSFNGM